MKKTDSSTTAVTVKLETQTKKRLQKLGKIKQRSTHWLMKLAITNYLELEEYEEQLKQDTLNRWQEASQGKFLENEKVLNWLDSWGSSKEKETPW